MLSNRLAFIAVGFACVVAAGGGSYFATRHNAVDQFAAPTSAATATTASTTAVAPDVTAPAVAAVPAAVSESVQVAPPAEAAPTTARSIAPPVTAPTTRSAQVARGSAATKRKAPEPRPSGRVAQRSEPSGSAQESTPPAVAASSTPAESPAAQRSEERVAEVQTPPAPPQATFQELVVAADSVVGLQTETTLSSERARIEDRVEARVARDVRVGGRVAIPAGTRALGSVVVVERGGKLKERARLGIRFHTLALADGTRLPISTETIYRYGDAPGDASAKKIGGGAVAGAILGAIIGGGKGAAIGATAGAAGGGAVVMNGDRSEAVFQSGADVTARIVSPVTVTIER